MNKTIFILFFVLISLVFIATAQPPFEPQESPGVGLTIEFQKQYFYNINEEITLNFHIFNSTGFVVDNTTTSCHMHTFNQSAHLEKVNLKFDNDLDFEFNLNRSLYQTPGTYTYILYCNNSEAGFLSNSFIMNDIGEEKPNNIGSIISISIFIILLFGLIGFYGYLNREEKTGSIILALFGFGVAMIQILFLVFIVYIHEAQGSLIPLLLINFYTIAFIVFIIGFISLLKFVLRLINPEDDMLDEKNDSNEKGKWQGR